MDGEIRTSGPIPRRTVLRLDWGVEKRGAQFATKFWLLQSLGWLGFGLVSMLGGLPLHEGVKYFAYYAALSVAGFLATLPLRRLCRGMWEKRFPWPRLSLTLITACFLLGFVCSLAAIYAESSVAMAPGHPRSWRVIFAMSFADGFSAMVLLVAWCVIYLAIKQWESAHVREQRLLRLESLARDAELRALRYEITPHFLFNTLNGVSTLVGEGDTQGARRMIALLGDFLRTTLDRSHDGDVTLGHEIRHMREYLAIEQVRLGERMEVRFRIAPDAEKALVPKLLLQPLLENAIRHGIAQCASPGVLEVSAEVKGESVEIAIANSYEHDMPEVDVEFGLGLTNTWDRLVSRYGDRFQMEIVAGAAALWSVLLTLPLEAGSEYA